MAVADAALTLAADDFTLFGVPKRFAQDRAKLDARWKELQREAHPDRFAAQSAAAQRQALQWSVRINEAYQRLKDPLRRAVHLLELRGIDLGTENNTAMEPAFLMQQMEWREAVEDARDARNVDELDRLLDKLRDDKRVRYDKLGVLLASNADRPAAEAVRQLMFLEKVQSDIGDSIAALEDA